MSNPLGSIRDILNKLIYFEGMQKLNYMNFNHKKAFKKALNEFNCQNMEFYELE